MTQVLEFALPDLGEGLTEALIVRWLVEVGDVVEIDQPVVEVETAKAMVEVPCPHGGVVATRFGEEGTDLPVGAPLIAVAVEGAAATGAGPAAGCSGGAAASGAESGGAAVSGAESGGAAAGASGSGNVLVGYGTVGATGARRRRVRRASPAPVAASGPGVDGVDGAVVNGAGAGVPASVTVVAPPHSAVDGSASGGARGAGGRAAEGPVPVISPLVRKLARDHGVNLRGVTGSGPEGLILRTDVESFVRDGAADGAEAHQPAGARTAGAVDEATETAANGDTTAVRSAAPLGTEVRIPLRGMRAVAADKLSRSRSEIPDATCWVDADATELLRARKAMNAAGGPKISLLAVFARITTAALARFPELNSRVDTGAREIVRLPGVHLGFAAQTDRGLVVPVVRDAHARDAESLSAVFARLTESARSGRLSPAELTGGTFTLNNYGVFGVDGSTPIINHPEAAMLGIGRITPKPWVYEGELAVRQLVQLSLTFDHRVCDGGVAGGFLRYVADCVEQPAVLLRTL
ncbi:dihydrolipoamide acetyltransferase family protein [Streptomyces sp. NPDC049954]|uniref:dihydrolipoamide acetyltransferase family protein n=1 Tax=Streptomyces sp. NPDC049954 TaxID=3155779 RepID=UPI003441CD3C